MPESVTIFERWTFMTFFTDKREINIFYLTQLEAYYSSIS